MSAENEQQAPETKWNVNALRIDMMVTVEYTYTYIHIYAWSGPVLRWSAQMVLCMWVRIVKVCDYSFRCFYNPIPL